MVKKVIRESIRPFKRLFGSGSQPELPTEDPSVRALRERQVRELAELDEEENRRLKTAFRSSRGIRAFRRSGGSSSGVRSSSGAAGQRAFTRSRSAGGANP